MRCRTRNRSRRKTRRYSAGRENIMKRKIENGRRLAHPEELKRMEGRLKRYR